MWDEFKFNMRIGRGLCCVYEDDGGDGNGGDGGSGGGDAPVALADHEGKFSENWRDILPEDIRDEECFKNVVSLSDGMTQLFNAQKVVGKNKVALLDENSTDTERQAFYDAVGRPKTAADYPYEPDKEVPEEYYNKERIERGKTVAHQLGLTKAQWEGLIKWDNEELKLALGESAKIDDAELKASDEILNNRLGMAKEEYVHNASVFINTFVDEEDGRRKDFIAKYGRDPVLVEMFGLAAKKLMPHEALTGEEAHATPTEAQTKIDELQATEGFINGELKRVNPTKHARIVAELAELYKLANPEKQAG